MTSTPPAAQDPRLARLTSWLDCQFDIKTGLLTPVGGDASFRRYFRFRAENTSFLVMDAPPEHEDLPRFLDRARLFEDLGVAVPRRFAFDTEQGFLVLEDFGDLSLETALIPANADDWYAKATQILIDWQQKTHHRTFAIPDYDRTLLDRELKLFDQWFVRSHLQLDIELPGFDALCSALIESALAQPQVLVHRDFHCRNLMVVGNDLGIIDFQDAVIGPVTYDPVSLLKDCYLDWPTTVIDSWLESYYQRAHAAGLIRCDLAEFRRLFDWMGLQRHLKVLGIFARLHWRDGKSGYLASLPRVFNYVTGVTARYPEFARFHDFLENTLRPALAQTRLAS